MNEEHHAHENLVAKAQRSGDADPEVASTASEKQRSSGASAIAVGTEFPGNPQASRPQSLGMYLLEPFILILLFAYNFSCKSSKRILGHSYH